MGIPASGQPISIEGVDFYRLKDGRVTDIWTQFDGVAMGTRANARTRCWPVRVTRTIPPGRSSSGTKAAAARSPSSSTARSAGCTHRARTYARRKPGTTR
jgi:SnoaL-like polyketide cyclase